MAANVQPIFPLAPVAGWVNASAANIAKDGTGVVQTLFTAGANGAYLEKIQLLSRGTNAASVLRIFLNNGSDPTVAANNSLVYEVSLPATVVTEVAAQTPITITAQLAVPAGYKLTATVATACAAGWQVTAAGGNY